MAQASGAGDPALGAAVFKKCQSCHQVGDRAKNRVGPQLNDIIGRTAGGLAGAKYSKSMIQAGKDGLVWTEEERAKSKFYYAQPVYSNGTTKRSHR